MVSYLDPQREDGKKEEEEKRSTNHQSGKVKATRMTGRRCMASTHTLGLVVVFMTLKLHSTPERSLPLVQTH